MNTHTIRIKLLLPDEKARGEDTTFASLAEKAGLIIISRPDGCDDWTYVLSSFSPCDKSSFADEIKKILSARNDLLGDDYAKLGATFPPLN